MRIGLDEDTKRFDDEMLMVPAGDASPELAAALGGCGIDMGVGRCHSDVARSLISSHSGWFG